MVSILKKIFDMQFLFPVLIMFCSMIIHIYRNKWLTFLNCLIYDTFLWQNICKSRDYWKSIKAEEFCIETNAVRVYVLSSHFLFFRTLMSNHWQVKSEIFEAPATYRPNGLSRSDSSGSEFLVSLPVVHVNVAAHLAVCVLL